MSTSKKLTVAITEELFNALSELKKTEKYSQLSWSELYRDAILAGVAKMKGKK